MIGRRRGLLAVAFLMVATACSPAVHGDAAPVAVEVEAIEGSGLQRITLTRRAAERLGIETAAVELAVVRGLTGKRLVVPYAAILYTSDGAEWVYTNPEDLVFVRERVTVASVVGDRAVLATGDPGTKVVSVGVAELYGAETGLGAGAH